MATITYTTGSGNYTPAKGVVAVTVHLCQLNARNGLEYLPRGDIDLIMPSQVAGVMVSHFYRIVGKRDLFILDQTCQNLRIMKDLESPSLLGVVLLEDIEGMGVQGDNFFHAPGLELADILLGQLSEKTHLTQDLVSYPTCQRILSLLQWKILRIFLILKNRKKKNIKRI